MWPCGHRLLQQPQRDIPVPAAGQRWQEVTRADEAGGQVHLVGDGGVMRDLRRNRAVLLLRRRGAQAEGHAVQGLKPARGRLVVPDCGAAGDARG